METPVVVSARRISVDSCDIFIRESGVDFMFPMMQQCCLLVNFRFPTNPPFEHSLVGEHNAWP
jgi:hypothetical protein